MIIHELWFHLLLQYNINRHKDQYTFLSYFFQISLIRIYCKPTSQLENKETKEQMEYYV